MMNIFSPFLGAFFGVFLVFFFAVYAYVAFALMTIAKKKKVKNAWLAWIPVANLYLMTEIAKVPWWTLLIVLGSSLIPVFGSFIALGVMIWWWWKIAEARKKPGWISLLMFLPVINLIVIGIIAWAD